MGRNTSRSKVEEPSLVPYAAVSQVGRGPALVLAPHPDDEVFGCAGAVMRHQANGDAVTIVVVTDGGAGSTDPEAYVKARRAESERAAEVLGVPRPEFWGLADRSLVYGEALTARIEAALARTGACFVYLPSPTDLHPDHRALGLSGLEAVRRSGKAELSAVLYEVGAPLARPNRLLDLTLLREKKRAALECFASQEGRQRYAEQIEALNRFRTYTLPVEIAAAEAFRVIPQPAIGPELQALLSSDLRLDGAIVPSDVSMPLVSVIVRTIGRDTLGEALQSIATQLYPHVEVVVVNASGAPLPLEPTCGRFPLRIVGGDARLERARAANVGLEHAKGRLVAFLDDDDWLYPHHLDRLVGVLTSQRSARAAYAGVECIVTQPDGTRTKGTLYQDPFDPARLLTENYLPIHAPVFERALFTDEGCRFDEALTLYEDWDFWLQLSRKTTFLHVPEIGAAYRMPGGSALSGARASHVAEAAASAMLAKWSGRWTPDELATLWASARSHLSPSSEQKQARAALEAQRHEQQATQALLVRAQAQLDEARGSLDRHSRIAKEALDLCRLEATEARAAEAQARKELDHHARVAKEALELAARRHQELLDTSTQRFTELERQVLEACGSRDALVRELGETKHALSSALRHAEVAEAALYLARSEAAALRSEVTRASESTGAAIVARDQALMQAHAELVALRSTRALRGARTLAGLSPRLERVLGLALGPVALGAPVVSPPLPPPAPPQVITPIAPTPRPADGLDWGSFRRTTPVSANWGFERGTPIDRHYADRFFSARRELISGLVLEVQRDEFSSRYGDRIERVDTVDFVDTWKPTFLCDLGQPGTVLPEARYDCVMVPFTLHVIDGVEHAMRQLFRALKPGGVMLCTMSAFVPLEPPGDHDYWHLPAPGWAELAKRTAPAAKYRAISYGNPLSALAAIMGLASEELIPAELDVVDARFPVMVGLEVRAPR